MSLMKRSIVAFVLTLGLAVLPSVAYGSPQDDLTAAQAQLDVLGGELMALEESLARQTAELENTTYEVDETQARIDETSVSLLVARTTLAARMRSSYKTGSATMLGVVLGATDIEDFVSRVYYMDKVAEGDAAAIACVKALVAELESAHAALVDKQDEQRLAIDAVNDDIVGYQNKVSEALAYYEQLDAEVQAQIAAEVAATAGESEGQAPNALATALTAIQQPETIPLIEQPTHNSGSTAAVTGTPASPAAETEQPATDEPTIAPSVGESAPEPDPEPEPAPSAPVAPAPSAPSYSTFGGQGVASAYSCIGCPYVWGAAGPSSFDCSGLVCYCFGYGRGRATYNMIASLKASGDWKTSLSELNYGDLVFPSTGHVGIYIGDGMMIHAPLPGQTVCVAGVYAFYGGGPY